MGESVRVKIADFAVLKEQGILITIGLGSCVGVALYDPCVRVAGLVHILLSDSKIFKVEEGMNAAKYADTAIPLLAGEMSKAGAKMSRLKAKIAGGSQLFDYESSILSVGEKNIQTVRYVLSAMRIPLVGEDVGGRVGRTIKFFVHDGRVIVSTVVNGQKEI